FCLECPRCWANMNKVPLFSSNSVSKHHHKGSLRNLCGVNAYHAAPDSVEFTEHFATFPLRTNWIGPRATDEQIHSSTANSHANLTHSSACPPSPRPCPVLAPEAMETVPQRTETLPKEIFRKGGP